MSTILIGARIVLLVLSIWLVSWPAGACAQDQPLSAERRALARATELAKLAPGVRTRLIEPELAPDPGALRHLDAFVVRESDGSLRRVIYVNRQSDLVRQAAAGSTPHLLLLAAVVHHEAQHLNGASELEARRAEAEMFQTLVARHAR